jgi:hypothetical protein
VIPVGWLGYLKFFRKVFAEDVFHENSEKAVDAALLGQFCQRKPPLQNP